MLAAGCARGGAATEPAPSCRPHAGGTSLTSAKQVAVSYVTDIAAHHYDAAGRATEPCNRRQYADIRKLWKFMAGMPVGQSQVKAQARKGTTWPGSAQVDVTVYIRFGTPPYSSWITAATRTLRLDSRPGGWRVTTDVTKKQKGKLSAYGFQSYNRPVFLSGDRATVVYSAASDEGDARTILRTADSVVGQLWRRYGGGRAAQRPILFLVRNRKQAERLAHVQLGVTRTPAGFQYSSYAYIDLPQWESYDGADQRSMVVHELTHVASRAWLQKAPHSLVEGVAMYEENLWRMQHHLGRTALVDLRAFYRHGFPSMTIWERRETDWGFAKPIRRGRVLHGRHDDGAADRQSPRYGSRRFAGWARHFRSVPGARLLGGGRRLGISPGGWGLVRPGGCGGARRGRCPERCLEGAAGLNVEPRTGTLEQCSCHLSIWPAARRSGQPVATTEP